MFPKYLKFGLIFNMYFRPAQLTGETSNNRLKWILKFTTKIKAQISSKIPKVPSLNKII